MEKDMPTKNEFPEMMNLKLEKVMDLRYGENPHQCAALYRDASTDVEGEPSLVRAKQLQGKELSFNNLLDGDSALSLVLDFDEPCCAIVKHNNPCGAACAKTLTEAFIEAHACDPLSAFGGVIAFNRTVYKETAEAVVASGFVEVVLAPKFEDEAVRIFAPKKNLRLLEVGDENISQNGKVPLDIKRIRGGFLAQEIKDIPLTDEHLKAVTKKKPTPDEMEGLLFAWKISKFVKSNSIVLTQGKHTVGIGMGQPSRVDSVMQAVTRMNNYFTRKPERKSAPVVLASDAFFPMRDGVDEAAKGGVSAIIHPGGSIRDEEIITAANEHGMAMVFTGVRLFRH